MDIYPDNFTIQNASLNDFKPLPDSSSQYPIEYMESNSVIKLKEEKDIIHIGICNTENSELISNLKNFHDKDIRFYKIEKSELSSYLGDLLAQIESGNGNRVSVQNEKLMLDKLANDAPIVNLVNSVFINAIRQEASDIHIESFGDKMQVRYRIDGYLQTVRELEKERFPAVSTRIKIMANLNIMEKRLPQDGRITVHLDDDIVDLRVSIVPIAEGESIVLRIFNKKKSPLTLTQLGLLEGPLSRLKNISKTHNGLILVTGPTGSGKTTSLNAILQEIKTDALKIITIEDPIEYITDGIDQIQTDERIGLTFDSILRRILRQDPDIIMVGEIRDAATADLSIRSALTGHLVFSTLHTKDSISVITRLTNMGVEPYLLAAVLRCSIAQRLVRRICDNCKEQYKPTIIEKELFLRHNIKPGPLYRGKGCKKCFKTGYSGRTGVFELFQSDENIEQMIIKDKRESEIREYIISRGMKPLIISGLEKVLEGVTTIQEVERIVAV